MTETNILVVLSVVEENMVVFTVVEKYVQKSSSTGFSRTR
jgi:hypothetical protein